MQKLISFVLALVCVIGLVGCNKRSMNYIIENEPSITGLVEEIYDDSIVIYIETDGYPDGAAVVFLWMWRTRTVIQMYLWVMKLLCFIMVKSQKAIRYR